MVWNWHVMTLPDDPRFEFYANDYSWLHRKYGFVLPSGLGQVKGLFVAVPQIARN